MLLELAMAYGCFAMARDVWRFFARRMGAGSRAGRELETYRPQPVMPAQRPRRGRQEQPAMDQNYGGMPMPGGVTDFEITITGRHYDFH